MSHHPLSHADLDSAQAILTGGRRDPALPTELRRWVESNLMQCDLESHQYAFWRFVLSLIVAESARVVERRGTHESARKDRA